MKKFIIIIFAGIFSFSVYAIEGEGLKNEVYATLGFPMTIFNTAGLNAPVFIGIEYQRNINDFGIALEVLRENYFLTSTDQGSTPKISSFESNLLLKYRFLKQLDPFFVRAFIGGGVGKGDFYFNKDAERKIDDVSTSNLQVGFEVIKKLENKLMIELQLKYMGKFYSNSSIPYSERDEKHNWKNIPSLSVSLGKKF